MEWGVEGFVASIGNLHYLLMMMGGRILGTRAGLGILAGGLVIISF